MPIASEPGTILFGKYCVERVLGRGGMGVVVAARHVKLGELFAIKMLRPDLRNKAEANERFLREARASARLKGEHVVRVHDVDSFEDGTSYMIMEYLTGSDLRKVLDERGPLPLEEAVLYMMQACEAVAEAHENGIIHRDLKPANMFLTTRPNGTACIKVLDFGISKEMNPIGQELTQTGAFIGSPKYTSPERLANNKVAHAQSDIWALGIIFYELIGGRAPFAAKLIAELVAKIVSAAPVPLHHVRPGIPAEINDIVFRCLEKQPGRRYASAREIIEALEPFAATPQRPKKALSVSAPSPFAGVEATLVLPLPGPRQFDDPHGESATVPLLRAEERTATLKVAPYEVAAPTHAPKVESDGTTHTANAWGETRETLPARKNKNTLAIGAIAGVLLLIGGSVFLAGQCSMSETNPVVATSNAVPSGAPVLGQTSANATRAPAEVKSASGLVNQAAPLPEETVPAISEQTATPKTTSPKAVPANTSTKKKRSVRGYDE
jgi:serine/threonine protein kinase